ncbi:ImuA family protein [Flaviflagellibacter deserti]|uniref:ImuA family protein n=1 Tax=Flaviflagellibacter deserti TaxID=2267266 RepID=A0ABV9Z2S7_9HYPH
MQAARETLAGLRRSLAAIQADRGAEGSPRFQFGLSEVDGAVGGGLPKAALHEVFAAGSADGPAASGFGLAMVLRACQPGQTIVWVRQEMAGKEFGELYAPGLAEFGADPASFLVVRVRDAISVLRAGNEALRCQALGAVVIEAWGEHPAFDLTATRRLARRAARSGVGAFVIRLDAKPMPSAALSRWRVTSGSSTALATGAPGTPVFEIELLRHRAGFPLRRFSVEWDREQSVFRRPSLSRALVSPAADRPFAPAQEGEWRRAG